MFDDPYAEMRWTPGVDQGLTFDEQYRLAHLPHVAPDHPRALDQLPGRDYRGGRYERARVSIVADLGRSFLAHEMCRQLLGLLASASFAEKIAFELIETRAANLHATLVGDVHPDREHQNAVRQILNRSIALTPVVHGPFIGRFNRGRIYLPLGFTLPEDLEALDALSAVFARRRQPFFAVGLVNLRDELEPGEAADLAAILSDLRTPGARYPITEISWTATHDDLTLDMQRLETINLAVDIGRGGARYTSESNRSI